MFLLVGMSASLRLTGHNSNVVPLQSHALATPIDLAALLIPLVALAKKFEFAIRIKRAKYFPIRPVTATNGGTNLFQRHGGVSSQAPVLRRYFSSSVIKLPRRIGQDRAINASYSRQLVDFGFFSFDQAGRA